MKKVCQQCGEAFSGYRNERYCSKECHDIAMTAICPVCNKTYIKSYEGQKTCSRKCGSTNRTPLLLRTCKFCGKQFHGTRTTEYCSAACRKAFARQEQIRLIEHRDKRSREKIAKQESELQCNLRPFKTAPNFDKVMRYMIKHNCQYAKAYQAVKNGEE